MTNDHTSPAEESAGLTISPLELMLLVDAVTLHNQPVGFQMADGICKALFSPRVSRRMPETPQEAVVALQHIINRTQDSDTVYAAACAIAEIATEAALNGTIVDPLLGSDFESPSPAVKAEAGAVMDQLAHVFKPVDPNSIEGYDYKHQAWVARGRYVRCGHPALMACGCYGRIHQGERPAADAEIH